MMAGECYLTSIRLTVIVFAMLVSLTLGFFGKYTCYTVEILSQDVLKYKFRYFLVGYA